MIVYENQFVQAIAYLCWLGIAFGLMKFVLQVVRWDREYERFIFFPLRFAIYAIPLLVVPGLGLLVGAVMLRSESRVKRKFAIGSIYISSVMLVFLATAPWTAIR